jgi:hypothetical protein
VTGFGVGLRNLLVGFRRQEIHFMLGGNPHDLGDVAEIVELVEQRFQLLCRRDPEQRPRRFVRLVEIAVRNAARQPHQIAGLGLHPDTVELEVERAILYQDEFLLGGCT